MLQDEAPSRSRRSSSAVTDATLSGLAYSPANPSRDDGFRPLSSTTTATSTSPQPRARHGRQGLAREEDVWSHDAETAIFSIYSMYGVSVRDSVVPPSARQSQAFDSSASTSAAVPQQLRASQIGPKDIVGGTFSASSAAAMNSRHQHQYHDRRPTKEQFDAFSFGSKPAAAPRNVSRFSEDTTATSAARSESMYSSSSRGPSNSEEGTIEAAMVQKVGGAKVPPSAFRMDGEDWVVANPRLSFQLGTVLTTPAAENAEDPIGQPRGVARPESRLTLDLDPVVTQDSNTSAKGSYTRHRLLSAASGTNPPNTALVAPTTADSVYGTPLTSVPAETPFFSPHNPQSPPLTPASRRDMVHQEGYDHYGQSSGAKPVSGVGLAISQPPQLSARTEPEQLQNAPEHNQYGANGFADYPSRNHYNGESHQESQQGGPDMHVQRRQPLSPSSRPSSQYQVNQPVVNGYGPSGMARPLTPKRSSRPPSPNSAHAGHQQQHQNLSESSSPRRSGPAPSPMILTSPSPVYPPSSYNPGHSPSRPPSRNRTPQSHSPGPSRAVTPVDGSGQTLGTPMNGNGPLLPKTPSRSQVRQVHTASTSQSPPPSRISHSAQSSASTNYRNPSPSLNTPHISYSPPPKSDPSSQQTYPPISVSRIHSRQESTSTTSHTPSQLSQTPSTQYAPSTQSHQYSQHSSASTGASQSQYQPSMSNGYYQSHMQYEDRNRSFESKESPPQPPLPPGGNRALQLHLSVHNSPSRTSLSKNGVHPHAPTLRAKQSTASLAPSLVPSVGEEPDAFHVRNTYAQLEMFGVKGDGYEEGVERTRATRGRAAADSSQLKSSEGGREAFQRTKSQVLADEAIADNNEKRRELKPEEVKLLGSVDRYGFFTVPTHERYVVMPAQPLRRPLTASAPQSPQPNGPPPPRSLDRLPPTSAHPKETARIAKWNKMLVPHARDEGGNVQAWRIRPSKVSKVRGRVYKGVPDRWRAAVWEMLMSAYVIGHEGNSGKAVDVPRLTSSNEAATRGVKDTERSAKEYREGIEKPSTYDVQIDLDVPRTISGHIMFRTRYGAGQRSLFHVLHAFSLVCAECGYVQGMGPIAATLLSYLPPSLSYTALVRLHTSYNMHTIFSPGFPGLLEAIYVQEQITKMYMPDVYDAFKKHMISSTSYATKWYITLFAGVVPWQVMLRLWDVFWLEGSDVFIGLAVGVLWAYRDQITSPQANFETVLSLLSSFFVPEDEDVLLSWLEKMLGDAKLRNNMKTWRMQWQELVRTGKEGDALL